jgi:hypothetical protein
MSVALQSSMIQLSESAGDALSVRHVTGCKSSMLSNACQLTRSSRALSKEPDTKYTNDGGILEK